MSHKIPNIIHFIFGLQEDFGGKPFVFVHYLAILSAHKVNKPDKIFFHCKYIPDNYWWEKARAYVEVVYVEPPKEIFGNRLSHYAHQSDVLRLQILLKYGGIYLDLDTICVKSLKPLLAYPTVMGYQENHQTGEIDGLCNAVILSEKSSDFVTAWLKEYRNFRGIDFGRDYWDEHSVALPLEISQRDELRNSIFLESGKAFFYPHWTAIDTFFKAVENTESIYVVHLWESISYDKFLKNIKPSSLFLESTTFTSLALKVFQDG